MAYEMDHAEALGATLAALAPTPASSAGKRYSPSTNWPPLLALGLSALAVASLFALQTALLFGSAAWGYVRLDTKILEHLAEWNYSATILIGALLGQAVATLIVIWAARRQTGMLVPALSLHSPFGGLKDYLWAVPCFVVFGALIGVVAQWLDPQAGRADILPALAMARSPAWWMMGLVAIVGAPISEELIFRGFLFSAIAKSRAGILGAALITSPLWAVIH